MSDVAGYIDQIESGGGNEVDLSSVRGFYGVAIIVKTDISDYALQNVYINQKRHYIDQYIQSTQHNGGNSTVLIFSGTYSEPVTIDLYYYYDETGDSETVTIENIDISKPKMIFLEGTH